MELTRHGPDDPALAEIRALIRNSFAYMDGVIDPPSSMHAMTLKNLQDTAATAEVWSLSNPQSACVVLTPQPATLYIGKLCVAAHARGQGLARCLIDHAACRAAALHLPSLTLQVRVELTSNHRAFGTMGFVETGRTSHPGYAAPTSITFTKQL